MFHSPSTSSSRTCCGSRATIVGSCSGAFMNWNRPIPPCTVSTLTITATLCNNIHLTFLPASTDSLLLHDLARHAFRRRTRDPHSPNTFRSILYRVLLTPGYMRARTRITTPSTRPRISFVARCFLLFSLTQPHSRITHAFTPLLPFGSAFHSARDQI